MFAGIFSYFKALQLIAKERLWQYLFLPGLISLLLAISIGVAVWQFSGSLGDWILGWIPSSWQIDLIAGGASWVAGILILIFGVIIYKHLVMIAVSPFMGALSAKVETALVGDRLSVPALSGWKSFMRGLRIALRSIFWEMLLVLILVMLSFIPVLTLFTTIAIFLVQAYYAGVGNMDATLERHLNFRGSVRFSRRNWGLAVGNGAIFLLLLATIVGFFFAAPLATVASTIEVTKRLDRGSSAGADLV